MRRVIGGSGTGDEIKACSRLMASARSLQPTGSSQSRLLKSGFGNAMSVVRPNDPELRDGLRTNGTPSLPQNSLTKSTDDEAGRSRPFTRAPLLGLVTVWKTFGDHEHDRPADEKAD